MKLYNSNLSPFTARVRIVAYAKGLPLEMVAPPGDREAYLALNPLGKVPCLEVEGTHLPESETICEYLEDAHPEPSLHGATPLERARVRLLARIGDVYVMAPLTRLFGQLNPATRDQAVVDGLLDEMRAGLGVLEGYVDGGPHAAGGRLTLADASLMPVIFMARSVAKMLGAELFADVPKVSAYYDGICQHPAVARVKTEMAEALQAYAQRSS